MNRTLKIFSGFCAMALTLMMQSQAFAQEQGDMAATAPMRTEGGGIAVYSGGIGDDEINYIHSVQNKYDVKLLFTEANGMYLSDMPVTITDKKGEAVVTTVTKGPVLLVNLPVGSYNVTANQNGTTREQKISVTTHSLRTYQVRFPATDNVASSENN